MKKQLRDRRGIAGTPLERTFADFEAMEPAAGEGRTRKCLVAPATMSGVRFEWVRFIYLVAERHFMCIRVQ